MMTKAKLERINELANKAKKEELSKSEKEEQKLLREEYLKNVRASFKNQLTNMTVIDPEGNDVTPDKVKNVQKNKHKHGKGDFMTNNITQQSINTIRTLSIDAIEKAQSGHPGLPMGAAPMGYTLFTDIMQHNPKNANWFNRDRFILSAGHGSMLLYSLLHLSVYDVQIDDLKSFRQWQSRTPGHPEVLDTDGVEATTGPLGQGVAMAVGMAMAEAHLASKFNKKDFNIVDHYTYSLVGDGDIMEGI